MVSFFAIPPDVTGMACFRIFSPTCYGDALWRHTLIGHISSFGKNEFPPYSPDWRNTTINGTTKVRPLGGYSRVSHDTQYKKSHWSHLYRLDCET